MRDLRCLVFLVWTATALLVACGDDDSDAPAPSTQTATSETATPEATDTAESTPTATPAQAVCPLDAPSACELALGIEEVLQSGDSAEVSVLLQPQHVECTGEDPQGIDPAAAFCDGEPAGTILEGYLVGPRQSDALGYVRPDDFSLKSLIGTVAAEKRDPAGRGAISLTTVADLSSHCSGCFAFTYSWIASAELAGIPGTTYRRGVLQVSVERAGGTWRSRYFWYGDVGGDYSLLAGGEYEDLRMHRWPGQALVIGERDFLLGDSATLVPSSGDCRDVYNEPVSAAAAIDCVGPTTVATVIDTEALDNQLWIKVFVPGPETNVVGWVPADSLAHWP
jgi:hypothetical protein